MRDLIKGFEEWVGAWIAIAVIAATFAWGWACIRTAFVAGSALSHWAIGR
jgi:UPF0716 family protein affecting phage T7 exclusion